jgi:hypothetical protein
MQIIVTCHHNKIKDELVALAGKAFTPSVVCDEPRIHPSRAALANARKAHLTPSSDLLVTPKKQTGAASLSMDSGNEALTAS